MKKWIKKLTTLIAVTMIAVSMTASFAIPAITVRADDTELAVDESSTYAGNPDNFSGPIEQNKYKIWSILRGMGLSEYQASAVMGCWKAECEFMPELIEGNPTVSVSGGVATASIGSSYGDTDTWESRDNYISNTSQKYAEYHDCMTVVVLTDYWSCWGGDAEKNVYGIQQARMGRNVDIADGAQAVPSAYFLDGQGWCGIGLAQWTADRAVKLLNWCSLHNKSWWVLESQILFTMCEDGDDPERFKYWTTFKDNFKDSTDLNAITKDFANQFEGCWESNKVSTRQGYASEIYNAFHGVNPDTTYAYMILDDTDIPLPSYITQDVIDRSIAFSYVGKNLIYPRNNGFIFETTEAYIDDGNGGLTVAPTSLQGSQNSKNVDVYKGYVNELLGNGNTSQEYCLFELFGENLHWYRYLGEQTYSPNLADHIWSAWYENRLKKLGIVETVTYSGTNYISTLVYKDRPRVLSQGEMDNGYLDPRAKVGLPILTGYVYEAGEINMTFAKYIVALISLLIGNQIPAKFTVMLTEFETSDSWQTVIILVKIVLAFAMIAFIFSMVKKVANYATGKGGSPKDIIERFVIGVFAIGFLFVSLYNPSQLNALMYQATTAVDNIFNYALNESCENDEVIHCDDVNMQTHAYLWKTAIFQPWCRGQFSGLNYNECYTNYATLTDGQKAMPQSNQEVNPADTSGNPFFNSTKYTGDVVVPIGGGKVIRNWAAFLMSCGSKYHIDYTLKDKTEASEVNLDSPVFFPLDSTLTAAYDSTLTADTYRVIDAQFDVSPQLYADGSIVNNYTGAKAPNYYYFQESYVMLFNALMLFMMLPSIWGKIKSFFTLVLTLIQLIWFTIAEIFKEQTGFKPFGSKLANSAINYILYSLKIVVMVTLYGLLVDKGFVLSFVYIIACLTIQSFKITTVRETWDKTKHNVARAKHWVDYNVPKLSKR